MLYEWRLAPAHVSLAAAFDTDTLPDVGSTVASYVSVAWDEPYVAVQLSCVSLCTSQDTLRSGSEASLGRSCTYKSCAFCLAAACTSESEAL